MRKQTVASGERFITPELKDMEAKILGAEERATKLEYDLFLQVREQVLGRLRRIQETATALAQLDVLAAFAETARLLGHVPGPRWRRRSAPHRGGPASRAGPVGDRGAVRAERHRAGPGGGSRSR